MTFTDQKIPKDVNDLYQGWELSLMNVNNYYPFGMQMPGMSWNEGDGYRYGFQGQEKDNEIYGTSNSYDFGARMMDPRLGKFLSLDPLKQEFIGYSNYSYAVNSPLKYIDIEGKRPGDVIVAFGGGDWQMRNDKGLAEDIIQYVKDNHTLNEGGRSAAFNSPYWDVDITSSEDLDAATDKAYSFIKKHYNRVSGEVVSGGRVIIEGYSQGAVFGTHLSKRLKEDDIKVDLLITVDAASAWSTDKVVRIIPNNVVMNVNFYQTNPSRVKSHGGPNVVEFPSSTIIRNYDLTNTKFEDEDGDIIETEHSTIDDKTKNQVQQGIIMELESENEND